MIRIEALRSKLARGESIFGILCNIPSAVCVELFGLAGFEVIILDAEHTPMTPETAENLYRAADSVGVATITRVGERSPKVIQKFLDAGTGGLMAPLVETAEDALAAVRAVSFPPVGQRGLAPVRAGGYGLAMSLPEFVDAAPSSNLVVAQIETAKGIEEVEAICQVDGVDVIFMGPADLSSALGVPGQVKHPEVMALIEELGRRVQAAGKLAGTIVRSPEEHEYWVERGFRFFCALATSVVGQAGAGLVKAIKGEVN